MMDEKDRERFYAAMHKAINDAKNLGRLCYVYRKKDGGFNTTFTHRNDFLFRVYPGGRKELSVAGNGLLN